MRLLIFLLAALLALVGVGLAAGGLYLASLGGSIYYLLCGIAYVVAAYLVFRRDKAGPLVAIGIFTVTVPWALWDGGLFYWALFPRLLVPLVIAAVAALIYQYFEGSSGKKLGYGLFGAFVAIFVVFFAFAFSEHDVIRPSGAVAYAAPATTNAPVDWAQYSGDARGLRFAPFNLINRQNVSRLKLAWVYRTGDRSGQPDQNTPLAIGDTLYSCSPTHRIAAIDADTGKVRWRIEPRSKTPVWPRCRAMAYWADGQAASPQAPCAARIVFNTNDMRLMEVDARTGQLCAGFGKGGTVDLSVGMGPVIPGFYFQTSAPTIGRDRIVIGGWVLDNQEVGEPSGVIRAFNARTGELEWAWDLANPAITKLPPPGQAYTRATPNMWTTAAYDDKLGLVYLPLGNQTPDYFDGGRRLPASRQYNSSIVALDIETGRERWHFQTVHRDVWDYDVPAQPALIDEPNGKGGLIPAMLVGTKRGQIFYLNRATGQPLAKVAELPVPQAPKAPEEVLSPTQPASVGMPTLGATRLSEGDMWGATMFDQLICRIAFKRYVYNGLFSPPPVGQKMIQQPGNGGGINWWSFSYDPVNRIAYTNDIRVPSLLWLVKRSNEAASARKYPNVADGHGASPQIGLPYAEVTLFWQNLGGSPCVRPPFGTVDAIDMRTRKLLWQVPAGTSEKVGPFGIASHLPMPMGMPTYGGTLTTAGGLVFFGGTQDNRLRAYNSSTGEQLWSYAMPVGASATPMSMVSRRTGRQYVVISAGGAAHSSETGDYLLAFALQ
jgi:quinate dehydrogenase (quinone)